MKITPVELESALPPVPQPLRPVGPVAAENPVAGVSAAMRSADPAAALKILVEEFQNQVLARLGQGATLRPPPAVIRDPQSAASAMLQLLQPASTDKAAPRLALAVQQQLIATATERSLQVVARQGDIPPAARIAIERASQQLLRQLGVSLRPAPAAMAAPRAAPLQANSPLPPAAPQSSVPAVFVSQLQQALVERIGMLPRAALAANAGTPPRTPAEAIQRTAQLLQVVADDPVLSVRASPLALQRVFSETMTRLPAIVADAVAASPAAREQLADLRAVVGRMIEARPATAPVLAPTPENTRLRVVQEFAAALAERLPPGRATASLPAQAAAVVSAAPDLRTAVAGLARVVSAVLVALPAADLTTSRALVEPALDQSVRRTLMQLPAAAATATPLRAAIEEMRLTVLRFFAAADAAAAGRGLEARGWLALLDQAAIAMLRGGEPPFRFDLTAPRVGSGRRRRNRTQEGDTISGIESSEPDAKKPQDEPAAPPLWPRF